MTIDNLKFEGINSPLSFILNKNDKVVLYSKDSKISTKFYEVINGLISSEGSFSWGSTIKTSYLPLHNDHYFNENINLVDWLRQWSVTEEEREEVSVPCDQFHAQPPRCPHPKITARALVATFERRFGTSEFLINDVDEAVTCP